MRVPSWFLPWSSSHVALVVGAVLTQGAGSLTATVALRSVAGSSYAADGAAQIAINNLRTGYGFAGNPNEAAFNNSVDGSGCFGQDGSGNPISTLTLDGFYPTTGSGPFFGRGRMRGSQGDRDAGLPCPDQQLQQAGLCDRDLGRTADHEDILKVHGGVYSNSSVIGPVTLDAGGLWASGACTQSVATPKNCNTGQTIADPNYASDLNGTIPAWRKPPTSCTSGVAEFEPGYYDNAATLTTATNLCSTAWFKPGTYYFDFHNDGCANVCPTTLFPTSGNTWSIYGGNVVGGTPIDANGNTLSRPSTNPPYPGSCRSPITDTNAVGVQFVFGGSSRLYIDQNSHVEICGSYHANRPPIELYGLKTGSTPAAANANGLLVTSLPNKGLFNGANANDLAPGGGAATWTTTNASAQSTTLTARGSHRGRRYPRDPC